jgi:SAM-dependent MidA family methyltransferase
MPTQAFRSVITAGITIIVGVLVYNEVFDALPEKDFVNNTGLINATAINGTVESAMLLAPVALIVLVSAVILGYVSGFGGGGGVRGQ